MDGLLLLTASLEPFQKWALIAAAVLTILYAVMRPNRRRKDPLEKRSPVSLAGQREVEKQMTELIIELEKMSRQMTAQLDTRAAKLEMLIRDADERIAALQAAATVSAPAPTTLMQPRAVDHDPVDLPDPRHSEVYELAENGQSPHQIAQRLGRPYGEVELILALRGRDRPNRRALAS